jgi:hypothetical protein
MLVLALQLLVDLLCQWSKEQGPEHFRNVFVIVDDYDQAVINATSAEEVELAMKAIHTFIGYLCALTGISKRIVAGSYRFNFDRKCRTIGLESISNITSTGNVFSLVPYFGFIEEEFVELASCYKLTDGEKEKFKQFYNGSI